MRDGVRFALADVSSVKADNAYNFGGAARQEYPSGQGQVHVFCILRPVLERRFAEGFDPGLPPIIQPRVIVADINGDGDEDLFLPSTQGSCFVERSFLKSGYARAVLTATQQRPNR